MQPGFESLLPPLMAIALAILTRRVVIPLAMGVATGAFILAWADPGESLLWGTTWRCVSAIRNSVCEAKLANFYLDSHMQALAFSLLLGGMVGVLERGGGMRRLIQVIAAACALTARSANLGGLVGSIDLL